MFVAHDDPTEVEDHATDGARVGEADDWASACPSPREPPGDQQGGLKLSPLWCKLVETQQAAALSVTFLCLPANIGALSAQRSDP